ncbi:interferon-induced protein 44-like [Pagrus major]|uniref:interferon-induced protein 44-like n=1 Tax=Pagrus major TaxID=143350 RepID=UPI003CC86D47
MVRGGAGADWLTGAERSLSCNDVVQPEIYEQHCIHRAAAIIRDPHHPSHGLSSLLPSGKTYRSICCRSTRMLNSFFPQAVRLVKWTAPPTHTHIHTQPSPSVVHNLKIPKEDRRSFFPFVFNDIMGLEPFKGVHVDDINLALKGHVMDGYKFNPESKLSENDQYYNDSPADNDKVHVLVCVVPASTVSQMRTETVQKIRQIRMEASALDIPQVAIVTKIDEAHPEIMDDLQNIYKVKHMKEKMEQFSAAVGIPMTSIFPVKNYHEEIDLNSDIDSLILSALKHIITDGDDHFTFKRSQSE